MIPPPVCLLAAVLTVVVLAVCAVGAPWAVSGDDVPGLEIVL